MTDGLQYWLPTLNAFFGAGLGAAFYILLSTKDYLVSRSYDPKYNPVYVARFTTGLVAGVILATALGPMLVTAIGSKSEFSLTPGILAILGGFAAEAVQQILQRLVDVLVTLVRGDGSAEAQAKSQADRVKLSAEATSKLLDYEKELDPNKKSARLAELYSILKAPQS
jgi:hypothetical protein